MTAVLGASLGVSGIRAVSLDLSVDPPQHTEFDVQTPESAQDPWGSVTWAVHRLARENRAEGTPALALRDKNPSEAYGVEHSDGLALVTDIGAQIGALQESGELVGERTVALFDVGAGGVTVSIVDRESGRVHSSRRTTVLSGDGCDAALSSFLLAEYGLDRPLDRGAEDLLVEMVCSAKERLSTVTSVEVHGPFVSGAVVLHRSQLDDLVRGSVFDAVTLAASMLADGPRVDAVFAVGGGANMQIVRQALIDGLAVPVFVPREPELLAARGAAGIARGMAVSSVAAGASTRPRHSDSSSRRLTRLRGSRYLGGAVVALVAGGVVVSIAAAASTGRAPDTVVDYTQVITSSAAAVPPSSAASTDSELDAATSIPVTTSVTTTELPRNSDPDSTDPDSTSDTMTTQATTTSVDRRRTQDASVAASTTATSETRIREASPPVTRAPATTSRPTGTPTSTPAPNSTTTNKPSTSRATATTAAPTRTRHSPR